MSTHVSPPALGSLSRGARSNAKRNCTRPLLKSAEPGNQKWPRKNHSACARDVCHRRSAEVRSGAFYGCPPPRGRASAHRVLLSQRKTFFPPLLSTPSRTRRKLSRSSSKSALRWSASQTAEAALRLDRQAGPPGSPGISTMTLRPQHIFMICHPGRLSYFLRRNERDSDPDYRRE